MSINLKNKDLAPIDRIPQSKSDISHHIPPLFVMLSSTPSTPIKDIENDKDQQIEHDYDFEAPKYYNFSNELIMQSNDDQMIDLTAVSTCDDCTPITYHTTNHILRK